MKVIAVLALIGSVDASCQAIFYDRPNYRGNRFDVPVDHTRRRDIRNLGDIGYEVLTKRDRLSSFKVIDGACLTFYEQPYFRGAYYHSCKSGTVPKWFNNKMKSFKLRCPKLSKEEAN